MILCDRDIRDAIAKGRVKIEPSEAEGEWHIHASSMDLRLGNVFKLYEHSAFAILDPKAPESFLGNVRTVTVTDDKPFIVQPGTVILWIDDVPRLGRPM